MSFQHHPVIQLPGCLASVNEVRSMQNAVQLDAAKAKNEDEKRELIELSDWLNEKIESQMVVS